jgi:hypothetical protein
MVKSILSTSMHKAPETPRKIVDILVKKGADIDEVSSYPGSFQVLGNSLFVAATESDLQRVCFLLDHHAHINARAVVGAPGGNIVRPWVATALDGGAFFGRLDMLQLLIDAGGESAWPGETGFHGAKFWAQKVGDRQGVIQLLDDNEADGTRISSKVIRTAQEQRPDYIVLDGCFDWDDYDKICQRVRDKFYTGGPAVSITNDF